jgi:hypothetical protein
MVANFVICSVIQIKWKKNPGAHRDMKFPMHLFALFK